MPNFIQSQHPFPSTRSSRPPDGGVWNQYTGIVKGGTRTKSGPVSTPPCSIHHSSKLASVSHMHLQCAQSQKTLLILHSIPRLSSILTPQSPARLYSGEYIECPARPTGWLSVWLCGKSCLTEMSDSLCQVRHEWSDRISLSCALPGKQCLISCSSYIAATGGPEFSPGEALPW